MFIMSSTNQFYLYWISLNTLCCLTSSYVYAYMAAFRTANEPGHLESVNYAFETLFAISIVMRFFVDYYEEGKQFPVRDLTLIAKNYLRTDFLYDFIPLIPLQELDLPRGYARFFYVIKIFRLFNGFKLLNVEHIMYHIKQFYKSKVDGMIQSDVAIGEDIIRDNNNIRKLLIIKYIIRLAKLFYIIVSFCYFLGFTWYIFCELILEQQECHDAVEIFECKDAKNIDNFILAYDMRAMPMSQKTVVLMYFAFTSLSTVGFGDYHPVSEYERIFCALILLLGVSIFSYIMGEINQILTQYQALEAELDDGDRLTKFFGLMTSLNENVPLDITLRNKIEAHFDYKWSKDRN